MISDGSCSSLTTTLFEIMATRCAKRHVEIVSSSCSVARFTLAIIAV